MIVKKLSEKQMINGKTCCFEIAKDGVLGRCGNSAVASFGGKFLCINHLDYALSVDKRCECVIDSKTVSRKEFLEVITNIK